MNTTRLLLRALVIGHSAWVISPAAFAADDALRPIAFQNGVNQQALGAETAELARAITSLIDELQRNGFPVQSLGALTELAAQLNALGGTEMSAIAQRLRKLGENAQADPRATATEAYLAQQAIETRLKTLARQISIQQLREETARRLEALINRQLATQRETRAIASAKPDAERQRILESDQSGIGEDLATFFQTGENLLARLRESNSPAGAPAAPAPTFAERINGAHLTTLSNEAVGELKGKRYPSAYARQDALLAELRKILQGILSSLPKEQRLANALQQVSALLQQQQANDQNPTPPTQEANQQAADQAQNLANQVAPLSPEAAAALQAAQQALQNQPSQPQSNAQSQASQQTPQTPSATNPSQPNTQQAGNQQPQPQQNQPGQQQAANTPQPNQQQNQNGQQQAGTQQAQPQQNQPGQQQANTAQPNQQQNQNSQQQNGQNQQQQNGQQQAGNQQQPQQQSQRPQQNQSAAAALAAAQQALQNALTQAQQQNGQQQNGQNQQQQNGQQQAGNQQQQPGQPQNGQQQSQQQAGNQQSGQQQQNGQQQNGQNQQQQNQNTAQLGTDGQPPSPNQRDSVGGYTTGDAQNQIAGHGPDSNAPGQVIGALRREEREAFTALQGERYPAEYSAWVQQYWRNLAQEQ